MIKYFVRTTEEREFDYSPLPIEKLIDTNHNACKHYIDSLEYIKNYDSVLMEDDLVLCKNFQTEIEKVISQYPNSIINFFSSPALYYTTHYSTGFSYNQCTFFPKGTLDDIIPVVKRIYKPERHIYYGPILNEALYLLGISHLVYRPTLVQHIDNKSLLTRGESFNRNTIYFKDYIDELGIDYLDAFKRENRLKLEELRKQDREKWKLNREVG